MPPVAQLLSHARHVAVFLAAAGVLALVRRGGVDGSARDRRAALARALTSRGFVVSADDVQWVDRPEGLGAALGHARAVVRASPSQGEPADVFLVETRLSPEGVLLDVGGVYDLSETSGADE